MSRFRHTAVPTRHTYPANVPGMHRSSRHDEVEDRFLDLLDDAGLPGPDDVAHLSRALVFVWYEPRALVLVDLDELPDDRPDPFAGFDVGALAADLGDGRPPDLLDLFELGGPFREAG